MEPSQSDSRLHGRRKGKPLKKTRSRVMEQLLPRIRLEAPADGATIDPETLFDFTPAQLWLEVGFGGGEHLAAQAQAHPDIGFIGCEPFINGVAGLLKEMDARGLEKNVRVVDNDARPILDALPDQCLSQVFVLFPDPWPKSRHHKRRFIGPANLDRLARVMKPGARLRFASDHMGYVSWALFHTRRDGRFQWLAQGPADWRSRPHDWPSTRYEQKALAAGRHCAYLQFERRID